MQLERDEYKIQDDGIWISKKALEECKQHYCKVADKFSPKPKKQDLDFRYPLYIGKADVYVDLLKHFENFIDSIQEETKTGWIQELQERLDSLSKEDFEKVMTKYSRYGVDYDKLNTMLDESLSTETKESWNKRLGEETVSDDLEEEIDKYIKDNFTIDREELDRFGVGEKDYLYTMDRGDILAMVRHFTNLQKQRMMKEAVEATVTDIRTYKEENEVDFSIMLEKGIIPYELEQEVKLIIVKKEDRL